MSIFDSWNKSIDDNFMTEVNDLENGKSAGFPEVPHGTYEVKIHEIELRESKKGDPMLSMRFKILNGEFKNSLIFMNQVITSPFQIHNANDFLRSLDSGIDVKFKDYSQYNELLLDIAEEIENQGLEYVLSYQANEKGFPVFEIEEVFEKE